MQELQRIKIKNRHDIRGNINISSSLIVAAGCRLDRYTLQVFGNIFLKLSTVNLVLPEIPA